MQTGGALGKRNQRKSRSTPTTPWLFAPYLRRPGLFPRLPRSGVPAPPFCVLRTESRGDHEGSSRVDRQRSSLRGSPVRSIFFKAAGRERRSVPLSFWLLPMSPWMGSRRRATTLVDLMHVRDVFLIFIQYFMLVDHQVSWINAYSWSFYFYSVASSSTILVEHEVRTILDLFFFSTQQMIIRCICTEFASFSTQETWSVRFYFKHNYICCSLLL